MAVRQKSECKKQKQKNNGIKKEVAFRIRSGRRCPELITSCTCLYKTCPLRRYNLKSPQKPRKNYPIIYSIYSSLFSIFFCCRLFFLNFLEVHSSLCRWWISNVFLLFPSMIISFLFFVSFPCFVFLFFCFYPYFFLYLELASCFVPSSFNFNSFVYFFVMF